MNFSDIPEIFQRMTSVVIAEYDREGNLMRGNSGFSRLFGENLLARWHVFTQPRLDELALSSVAADSVLYEGLISLGDPEGNMRSVSGVVYGNPDSVLVVAGYDIEELESSLTLLLDLNNQVDLAQRELACSHRELQRQEQVIRQLSLTDALTGLGNRRHLDETLSAEVARGLRYKQPLSLAMLDLDHFKRVNDTWGHEMGDRVLQATASCLRNMLRQTDRAFRQGGEEFVLLMPATALEQATACAERLRVALSDFSDDALPPMTASLGVARLLPGESAAELLARADAALYRAKNGGRNRVVSDS